MENPLGSRDVQQRVMEAADRYRDAVAAVESYLATQELGPLPSWVFAVDTLPVEKISQYSEELAALEITRRASRQALSSVIEILALRVEPEDGGMVDGGQVDVSNVMATMGSSENDADWKSGLDRFITIVERARVNGCIYLNGTFTPVNPRDNHGSSEDVR